MSESSGGDSAIPSSAAADAARTERIYLIDIYKTFVDQINKEDNLTNHRMTWGITVNGGLIAILGIFYQAFKDNRSVESSGLFFIAIVATGVIVSWQTIRATSAANAQLYKIKSAYADNWAGEFARLGLTPPFAYGSDDAKGKPIIDPPKWWWPQYMFVVSISLWLVIGFAGLRYLNTTEPAKKTWSIQVQILSD